MGEQRRTAIKWDISASGYVDGRTLLDENVSYRETQKLY
jgi:hypothetical protein